MALKIPKIVKEQSKVDEVVIYTSPSTEAATKRYKAKEKRETFLDKKNKYSALIKRTEQNLHNQIDLLTNQLNHNQEIKIKERIELTQMLASLYTELVKIKNNDEITRLKNEIEMMKELQDYNSRNLSIVEEKDVGKKDQGYGIDNAAMIDFNDVEIIDVEIPNIDEI